MYSKEVFRITVDLIPPYSIQTANRKVPKVREGVSYRTLIC